ncbi:KTSC domain-containing protein [Acinetobacter nosocomialis]|uniref:KTSC domain-containing protein n=1 Tax=Acinetobacter calcoaceticus/baumannii complex TaxID=909768 RepID=UPI0002B94BD9|nr:MULTISPECIES: KTSC domain-containing protein [Acinetobacter calcoaceticus/baumannii complex]MDE1703639.1 KTSC domain-containing protein [Acinetobacter nosocomialis]MDQ9838177.1 KTSC domain-containing protein [Acinetobacter baumannii]TPV19134.1 KTSC domain-containing protein [Acinetobacter baumannii]HDG7210097.1 KTSC domain-containing protein [Acinetobacter nosocomialis]
MQQFQVNSELIGAVAYDSASYTMYVKFVDQGVLAIQQIPTDDFNNFLASQDKDAFLKEQLMINADYRKRIQTRSAIAKSLFQG